MILSLLPSSTPGLNPSSMLCSSTSISILFLIILPLIPYIYHIHLPIYHSSTYSTCYLFPANYVFLILPFSCTIKPTHIDDHLFFIDNVMHIFKVFPPHSPNVSLVMKVPFTSFFLLHMQLLTLLFIFIHLNFET